MEKINIAVLISGNGTNLQALIDAERDALLKSGTLTLAVSDRPGAYGLERAKKAGIPAFAVERESFEETLEALLAKHKIGLIVLAGFLRILSPGFAKRWEGRVINIHPSLIPAFCGQGYYGLRVHEAVLERGVKWTGATVHYVNAVPDGGAILLQKPVAVLPCDTAQSLQQRVQREAEWELLPQATELVCQKLAEAKK
ncbi:MAG: phosphoribosylglycinamide formyltransferase [Clostridiaceae bacterium]